MRSTIFYIILLGLLCLIIPMSIIFTTTIFGNSTKYDQHHEIEVVVQTPEDDLPDNTDEPEEPVEEIVYFQIEAFGYPLDEKWMSMITSNQGIRGPIKNNSGGTIAGNNYHNAIDIKVPEYTPVKAAKSGTVINVYPSYYNGGAKYKGHPIYGGLIEISHNDGTKTLYAHLSMTEVREGDIVTKGQRIGRSGGVAGKRGSGNSNGPHLHYAIILDIESFIE